MCGVHAPDIILGRPARSDLCGVAISLIVVPWLPSKREVQTERAEVPGGTYSSGSCRIDIEPFRKKSLDQHEYRSLPQRSKQLCGDLRMVRQHRPIVHVRLRTCRSAASQGVKHLCSSPDEAVGNDLARSVTEASREQRRRKRSLFQSSSDSGRHHRSESLNWTASLGSGEVDTLGYSLRRPFHQCDQQSLFVAKIVIVVADGASGSLDYGTNGQPGETFAANDSGCRLEQGFFRPRLMRAIRRRSPTPSRCRCRQISSGICTRTPKHDPFRCAPPTRCQPNAGPSPQLRHSQRTGRGQSK